MMSTYNSEKTRAWMMTINISISADFCYSMLPSGHSEGYL